MLHLSSLLTAVFRPCRRRSAQRGFTLIELIVVLVILGILAAFAIPRFASLNSEARQASVRGLAAGLRRTTALVHGLALARGMTAAAGQTLLLEGAVVKLVHGYPEASGDGVGNSVMNLDGFTHTVDPAAGTVTYVPENAPASSATCSVVYTQASAGVPAQVELNDEDCS